MILLVGDQYGFSNTPDQYDEFKPGSLFDADGMEPFSFSIDDFNVDWLTSGPRAGMARGFESHLSYQESLDSPEKTYDLRVNHPLTIGDTERLPDRPRLRPGHHDPRRQRRHRHQRTDDLPADQPDASSPSAS